MAKSRPSRCLSRTNAPQELHWAQVGDKVKLPLRELEAALAEGIPPKQLIDVAAWLDSTLERIAQCRALDPDDVVPVAQHSDLWELRIDLTDSGFLEGAVIPEKFETSYGNGPLVRIYEAEVVELPRHMVALHAHLKIIANEESKTRSLQDARIQRASTRFTAGRPTRWGLPE